METNRDTIVFNGIKFNRYPDAKGHAERSYYVSHGGHRRKGVGRLHEEIWKAANGPIPSGHHIHHEDRNPLNNDPSNLVCVPNNEHARIHAADPPSDRKRAHLESIRHLSVDWHRSDDGRAWHSEHGKQVWAEREPVERICEQCGGSFPSLTNRPSDRFCSNNCKSNWRRLSGIDNIDKTCPVCGSTYNINKYSASKTCSSKCGAQLANAKRAANRGG